VAPFAATIEEKKMFDKESRNPGKEEVETE
jgi:hypothetical protein